MKKQIIITGGAGSLGRAFVKYLLEQRVKSDPYEGIDLHGTEDEEHLHALEEVNRMYDVTVIDSNEWAIAEMRSLHPTATYWLGDFVDYPLTGSEDVIIHAAAYKHVDLGESNVSSFITNNITKTAKFYEQTKHTLARVLYISTDKAVEPISAYGATKYLAEVLSRQSGGAVARLGNLLDSSGSVIPTWEHQIKEGLPITITDERMTRYMIDVDDAVNQIWSQFLEGRKLIIPEMGEPVRLLDLMAEVLKRHGYEKASDYTPGVQVIGMRPGEKLHEKLIWDHELTRD